MHGPWFAPLFALALFCVGLALLPWAPVTPAAWAHLLLALAVLPLILAAMGHFAPVLTRGAPPPGRLRLLPPLAFVAGLLVIGFLQFGLPLLIPAALLAAAVALIQLGWMYRRAKGAFGAPHPGFGWYLAALGSLVVALLAIATAPLLPEQWGALRRLHLHLNLLGFVGLTALGTLWVLLPTAAGYGEPETGVRLRKDLPVALAGTVLSAVGAAWWWPLSLIGAVLWSYALGRFLLPLFTRHHSSVWGSPGAARGLAAAAVGLAINLVAGVAHALGGWPPPSAALFVIAFLLPLVSGAAAHLIPLWRWPGPPTLEREAVRGRLAAGHGLRGGVFVGCGAAVAAGLPEAGYVAALALLHFVLVIIVAVSSAAR